ncbi:MAG TPA: UPF0175 family protein [Parafilimonas sp.]|nr:UPF0175 family protein [Parafilimonas sp.]
MKTLTMQIPDDVDIEEKEFKFRIAAQLYREAKVSLGEGAIMAEVSKRYFIENLASVGVSLFNYGSDELIDEVKNA